MVEDTESVTLETYLNECFLFSEASLKIKLFAFVTHCHMHASFGRVARKPRLVPSRSSLSSRRASFLSRRSCRSISSLIRRASFASSLRQHAMMESSVMILPNNSQLRAFQQFHWNNISPNSNAIVQTRQEKESPWGENPNHIQNVSEWLKSWSGLSCFFISFTKATDPLELIAQLHVVFIFGVQYWMYFFNTVIVPLYTVLKAVHELVVGIICMNGVAPV